MIQRGYYKVRYKGQYSDLLWIGSLDDSDLLTIKEQAQKEIGSFLVDILDISPFEKSAVRDYMEYGNNKVD